MRIALQNLPEKEDRSLRMILPLSTAIQEENSVAMPSKFWGKMDFNQEGYSQLPIKYDDRKIFSEAKLQKNVSPQSLFSGNH